MTEIPWRTDSSLNNVTGHLKPVAFCFDEVILPITSPAMNFRAFISLLEKQGDLVTINTPVDEYLEVGAITCRVYETRQPAPFFQHLYNNQDLLNPRLHNNQDLDSNENLDNKKKGFRILGAPAGMRAIPGKEYSRLAAHFDLPENASPRDIVTKINQAAHSQPLPPVKVLSGACKENIWRGDDVDLTRLPMPQLHAEDGGRYFGTYGMHIVQSPDGNWDSWSVGRLMFKDKHTLVGPAMPMQHIGMIHQMWTQKGLATPWAMALGAPPAALAVAGMPLPEWVSEPGYVAGLPPEENHTLWGTMMSAQALALIKEHALPIDMAWCSFEAASCWIVLSVETDKLAKMKKTSDEFIKKIAEVFFNSHVGWLIPKIILVGNDIDITRIEQVVWAIATRSHPAYDYHSFQHVAGIPLVPYLREEEKKAGMGGKSIINCLFPEQFNGTHRARPASFAESYPAELQASVLKKWQDYGFIEK